MDATPDNIYDASSYHRNGRGRIYDSVLDLDGVMTLVRLPCLIEA